MKFSDLLNDVLVELPGCTAELAENAVKRSVRELCKDSRAWRHWPDGLDVVIGENAVDLEVPAGSECAIILSAKLDSIELEPKSVEALDLELGDWRNCTGCPKFYLQLVPSQIVLAPVPDIASTAGLVLTLALQPRMASTTFPDWISERYYEGIVSGAKGLLMMMAGKPWSNPQLGAAHRMLSHAEAAGANADAATSMSRAPVRTTSNH